MNYASIRTCDIANGEGVRVTLFVSGCTHRCKGCFNPDQWDFDYGEPFTREVEDEILKDLEPSYIAGLSILGGEPMEPENQRALVPFLRRFREKFGETKTLWVYTGCVVEELQGCRVAGLQGCGDATLKPCNLETLKPSRWHTEVTDEFLRMIDVLVDGPFIEELKDISLQFRGSSNQRILRLREEGKGKREEGKGKREEEGEGK